MKIKTWIKYEESYLPPRCRKLRYKECEDHIDVNLREARLEDLRLAFEDNSYEGKGEIYSYRNKLWAKVKMPNPSIIEGLDIKTPLDYLKWCNDNCSTYFFSNFEGVELVVSDIEDIHFNGHTEYWKDGTVAYKTDPNNQCICRFQVRKTTRKITWNDIYKIVNSVKPVPYSFNGFLS